VLSVEPVSLDGAEEELGSIGVRSGVGHGKDSRSSVLELEVLVSELLSIDGLSSGSVSAGEVTTLAHEGGDDTVEGGSLEVKGLSRASGSLLSGAEAPKVLSGLGDNVGAEGHLDPSSGLSANGHVEVNNRVRPG